MLKIENVEVTGWEHVIRGMRNPKNSWGRSDSTFFDDDEGHICTIIDKRGPLSLVDINENDHDLMMRLANGGPVHAKYRRMITVYLDITAPLYWWKEFDTYKVGTVANSCSTMHMIHTRNLTMDDFSHEHLDEFNINLLRAIVSNINNARRHYVADKSDKESWWQMIQLLPTSYNQRRTVMLNYEVLTNIYHSRMGHKLDEWHVVCEWIETLPYSELITGKRKENGK